MYLCTDKLGPWSQPPGPKSQGTSGTKYLDSETLVCGWGTIVPFYTCIESRCTVAAGYMHQYVATLESASEVQSLRVLRTRRTLT